MQAPAKLSLCIVNWNTIDDLRNCLRAAETYPYTDGVQEVIVVDNASGDGSAEMVRAEFPAVRLIANTRNENYARGTNQCLQTATGDLLLLLNPDVEVRAGALNYLVRFLCTKPDAGAVAARLIYPDGQTQSSVRGFPTPTALFYEISGIARLFPRSRVYATYRQSFFDYDKPGKVPQPMASCFLVTRRAYETVGGMDERFPLYFNDVDWCLRAYQAGFSIYYTAGAAVTHQGGGSTRKVRTEAVWESHRGLLRFYEKHYRATIAPPIYRLMRGLILLGAWARTGRWGQSIGNGGDTAENLHRKLEHEG